MKLVLASESRYRAEVLRQLRVPFVQVTSNHPEETIANEPPKARAQRLAIEKAEAVAKTIDYPALIIGSDQVASINDELLSKPGTVEKAKQQLAKSSGQNGHFYTGCCVYNTANQQSFSAVDTVTVKFRTLTQEEIAAYIKQDNPLDCAGSFKIEALGIALMEEVRSNDPTSLVGLGLINLCNLLKKHNFNPIIHTN
ncbi:Maf family protein [Halioxenophilus aromaticivorans]|uniref:7-methyl-GTP pyrophosphatase n=1 Tax=Halioxenophilus aromaticivorans TaxID=1306992 RepID=A0AAV3UA76_9ALTE